MDDPALSQVDRGTTKAVTCVTEQSNKHEPIASVCHIKQCGSETSVSVGTIAFLSRKRSQSEIDLLPSKRLTTSRLPSDSFSTNLVTHRGVCCSNRLKALQATGYDNQARSAQMPCTVPHACYGDNSQYSRSTPRGTQSSDQS